jgi:hypothetical protein
VRDGTSCSAVVATLLLLAPTVARVRESRERGRVREGRLGSELRRGEGRPCDPWPCPSENGGASDVRPPRGIHLLRPVGHCLPLCLIQIGLKPTEASPQCRLNPNISPPLTLDPFILCKDPISKSCRATCKLQLRLNEFGLVRFGFQTTER